MTILTPFFCQICGISLTRVKEFRNYLPKGFELEEDKVTDELWREMFLIDGFNKTCNNIAATYLKVGNESMSKIRFRKMAKRNLPHLSFIFHNPESLG